MSGFCEIWIGGPISALAAPAKTQGQAAHSYAPIRSIRLDEGKQPPIDRRTACERNGIACVGVEQQFARRLGDLRRHRISIAWVTVAAVDRTCNGTGKLRTHG